MGGSPSPYVGMVRTSAHGVEIATAPPELFLRRVGRTVESGPVKGTSRTAADLLDKDHAENIMIVDLVRNDLGRVCATGSVTVPDPCAVAQHPGLVYLVSTVRGELAERAGSPELLAGTFPPGSVTGAPKSSALRVTGLQNLAILAAAPFTLMMVGLCIALTRDLRQDPLIILGRKGKEAIETAVIAGHETCDGDFELRIGPDTSTDDAESTQSQQSTQPAQSTSSSAC